MKRYGLGCIGLLFSAVAEAHTGIGSVHGLAAGFVHPFSGADHLAAMLAVGVWSAQTGGRRLWLLPAVFVAVMACGALLAMTGFAAPYAETGILLSDLTLLLFIICGWRISALTSVLAAALFAYFHGAAHGLEAPAQADGWAYIAGFCAATALIHLAGIAIGMRFKNDRLIPGNNPLLKTKTT